MSRGNTPTIKRILRESLELSSHPSPDIHASPLSDSNLFEWHFTIRGPSPPSPYSDGIYHGRIVLPPTYPLRPPSFRFLTPSGRFEVNREICLSISGHHEETWQPAWGIRTALVAIRAFMESKVDGQVGGLECSEEVRVRLAGQSRGWRCAECGKNNEEILEEERKRCEEVKGGSGEEEEGAGIRGEEKVPEGLRLGYRDEIAGGQNGVSLNSSSGSGSGGGGLLPLRGRFDVATNTGSSSAPPDSQAFSTSSSSSMPLPQRTSSLQNSVDSGQNQNQEQRRGVEAVPEHLRGPLPLYLHPMYRPGPEQQGNGQQGVSTPWLDKMIGALLFLLIGMVWRKLA